MKVINEEILKKVVSKREGESHKGSYGRVLLIGGTYPYGGAIIMAALAVVYSGVGLVTVATDRENIPALHSHLPEAMGFDIGERKRLKEQIRQADLVLIGPGLAEDALGLSSLKLVFQEISEHQILVLDGGALNLVSKEALPFPKSKLILTPHQREWERLSGLAISEQSLEQNQEAVNQLPRGTILVHKRAGSQVYVSGSLERYQLSIGGPYQATGGMGDTLAGMVAGFAVQFHHVYLLQRVLAALYLHSAIADDLAKDHYVTLPTQISRQIPRWMRRYVGEK